MKTLYMGYSLRCFKRVHAFFFRVHFPYTNKLLDVNIEFGEVLQPFQCIAYRCASFPSGQVDRAECKSGLLAA